MEPITGVEKSTFDLSDTTTSWSVELEGIDAVHFTFIERSPHAT